MPPGIVARNKTGQFSGTMQLTEKQKAFVRIHVLNGVTATEAARQAGYGDAGARAFELVRKPHVIAAIHEARERHIGELASIGLKRAHEILTEPAVTQAGKELQMKVAFKMLDLAGHQAPKGQPADAAGRKPLAEMSVAELEEFIRRGREAQAQAAHAIIDGQAITLDGEGLAMLPAPEPAPEFEDDDELSPGED